MYTANIFPSSGGVKKQPPMEILEGETVNEVLTQAVILVKSFPRGRPYPIIIENQIGDQVARSLVHGTTPHGGFDFQERMKNVRVPVRTTTLRKNEDLPIVFDIEDQDPEGGPITEEERRGDETLRRFEPKFMRGNVRDD
jgi:hypothetical protein